VTVLTRRAWMGLAALAALAPLGGCGFQLRGVGLTLGFRTLRLQASADSDVLQSLRAQLQASGVQVLDARSPTAPGAAAPVPDVVLHVLLDQRERVVVGTTSAGQVRELLLRRRVRFALRTPGGRELIESTELQQERELSYAETVALGKEAEEALLFADMRTAIVRQWMALLAHVNLPAAAR
jgi:LPS-assembly lipoprotein